MSPRTMAITDLEGEMKEGENKVFGIGVWVNVGNFTI